MHQRRFLALHAVLMPHGLPPLNSCLHICPFLRRIAASIGEQSILGNSQYWETVCKNITLEMIRPPKNYFLRAGKVSAVYSHQ